MADKPTVALDSEPARAMMDMLRRMAREQEAAFLVLTGDDKILGRFDRMAALRDGRIEAIGAAPVSPPTS